MLTRKDRKIANEKAKVKNRDEVIEKQSDKIMKLESALRAIRVMTTMNKYGCPEVYLRKINELAKTAINN